MMLVVPFEHFLHGFICDAASAGLAHDCEWLSVELKHTHVGLELFLSNSLIHIGLEISV